MKTLIERMLGIGMKEQEVVDVYAKYEKEKRLKELEDYVYQCELFHDDRREYPSER
jgi:hypothetical protein